jgi:hypothetical protein
MNQKNRRILLLMGENFSIEKFINPKCEKEVKDTASKNEKNKK